MKKVGRRVEQSRGGKKKVRMPIYFTTKHLSFAIISKVCFVTILLSFQLWHEAKCKKIFPVSKLPGASFICLRKSKGMSQPCWSLLPALARTTHAQDTNVFGLNMSMYRKKYLCVDLTASLESAS